jgi:DNA processing protein
MFGLKEAEVAGLIRAVSEGDGTSPDGDEMNRHGPDRDGVDRDGLDRDGIDRDGIEERFARATWTGIAEPGDRIAGLVVEALGAPRALAAVVERWSAESLLAELGENGSVGEADVQQAIERWQPRLSSGSALIALRQAARFGARLRVPSEADWPEGFAGLEAHAPLALWTRGRQEAYLSLGRSIALVGARAATGYGEHVTMEASAGLVDRGYSIVSGAAYGIDGMAHRAALASHGMTIAFLAGGVDRFYPSGHDALLTRIVEAGMVISELPCGAPPTKWRFLQRNRLIAAASLATIVLEAGWRSGSLNTANHASSLGRPIGAVPGPVTSAASAGCHRLIRENNAVCVTNADEMAELAPLHAVADAASAVGFEDPSITRVLDAVSTAAPRSAANIAQRAGLSVGETQGVLARLQLVEGVYEIERGWMKKAPDKQAAQKETADKQAAGPRS